MYFAILSVKDSDAMAIRYAVDSRLVRQDVCVLASSMCLGTLSTRMQAEADHGCSSAWRSCPTMSIIEWLPPNFG